MFGLRAAEAPSWCPGRVHLLDHGLEAQIADPGPLEAAVARLSAASPPPRRAVPSVGSLPDQVVLADLPVVPDDDVVLVGVGDADLGPIGLAVRPGDHVLVAGPARSGRTNALGVLALQLRRTRPGAWLGAVVPRPTMAIDPAPLDAVAMRLDQLDIPADRPAFLFVDDAELVDDPGGALSARLAGLDQNLHVIAAARPDALRAAYGHWTQLVRRSRLGILLKPDPLVDGDLLGVTLPRGRRPIEQAGRGYVVADATCELAQLASARSAAVSVGPPASRSAAPPTDSIAAKVYANPYPSTASCTTPRSRGPKATPKVDTNWLRL
jgi:S-DNA-T family DNA segregation ATPase FtsK/SpoIIIE